MGKIDIYPYCNNSESLNIGDHLTLSAPKLWINIPVDYPRWAQEMLIRSKMAKLTIQTGHSFLETRTVDSETIRSCLYEMNRVEEIGIDIIPELATLEEIFCGLPKSAPQLAY